MRTDTRICSPPGIESPASRMGYFCPWCLAEDSGRPGPGELDFCYGTETCLSDSRYVSGGNCFVRQYSGRGDQWKRFLFDGDKGRVFG